MGDGPGVYVGAGEGRTVGTDVGSASGDGADVGDADGDADGDAIGDAAGDADGEAAGDADGDAIGEGNYDHKTGILRAADGTEYKNDDIEAAAKYFEERCKTLHKDPARKKESEFSAIAYEAIKIMKGRFGSNF